MHPTDRKIFSRMIRLLRQKRSVFASSDEFPSPMEMIEPTPPVKNGTSSSETDETGDIVGPAYFEPSLNIVRSEGPDASKGESGWSGWPSFSLKRASSDDDEGVNPIHLDVHNTESENGPKQLGKAAPKAKKAARTTPDAQQGPDRDDTAPEAASETPKLDGAKRADDVKLKGALLRTVPFRETSLVNIEEEAGSNPAFNIFANARIWRHDERNLNYSGEVAKLYRDVFTPTRPKRNYRDFSGRRDMIEAIIQAVEEERSHVILMGEKSLGKTSLLNIVGDCATEAGYLVARMTGTADMTFRHFIVAILEQFSARIAESPVNDILQKRLGTKDLCDFVSADQELDVPAAIKIFQRLSEHQAVVMVDDFERIECDELKGRIGELMGVLSDQGAWLSLLLFGRASRAGEFLPESFETLPNVTWIKMQPMSDEDAARVIARGVSAVGVQFSDDVSDAIIRLSQGIPSAIQWLCLLAIRNATQRYASEVEIHDLAEVIKVATVKIDARLSSFYDRICGPARGNWADDILYLAVRTPADSNGVFSTDAMSRISQDMIGKPLLELPLHSALSRFSGEDDPVLEKVWTSSGTCYRFVNPAMRSIVMLKNSGRLPSMPDALLEGGQGMDLLPSPDAAPNVA